MSCADPLSIGVIRKAEFHQRTIVVLMNRQLKPFVLLFLDKIL
jgi:hypothetical protein